ncbi:hypothetical protein FEF65_09640 [Mariprofundus erugo]|uniref:Flagellar protein FliT n=1 Tax=Mariprofundus erugo TaxID=2528639 RepID=A0A5R9GJH2_9PROT|nr:hypothetical protein [Mariprofundus erugo]TLS66771.1 hypothetical protein FEF65_09640 [Mariprofundus erugo]
MGRHAESNAVDAVAACRARLSDFSKAIQRGQWQKISGIATEYSALFATLAASEEAPLIRDELAQLDILRRRCMRQLARHMKAVSEDIASLEAGQKTLKRSRELADSIFNRQLPPG